MKRQIKSPSKYIQGEGEIRKLKEYSDILSEKRVYILVDKFVYDNYKEDIEFSYKNDLSKCHIEVFTANSTKKEIGIRVNMLKEKDFGVIIGIGGGKITDVAKAISYYSNLPIIIASTVASTDAPCSSLSVLYDENGKFLQYLHLKENPNIVLMDTKIIVNAPARFLVSGMGDALSTYYEAKACYDRGVKNSKVALALAKLCLDTIIEKGYLAKLANEKKEISEEFEDVVEANTYLSGIGFESGGEALAHALHNGFTILEEIKGKLHGEIVAFSTIVQMLIENREKEEIDKVIKFCKKVGLPTNFKDLGIENCNLENVIKKTLEDETVNNMPFKITKENLLESIIKANELGK
ncbi:glycerol dehydrogenase [Oceanivirga miroungae]|uniref:Glycerol dehydrogenase n=1 Tax=Oceanivirga miroungae TaxID=1130046 RepID=A0A6I8M5Z7_9FUSO|nr:glycerol dehydrogenase [Oceanivirga miroungae]VWL84832.1 iron-containing alcohol dehydrogenase [Oceanivirga miroungae]